MTKEEAYKWLYVHFAPCGDETAQDEAVNVALNALAKQIPKKPVLGYAYPEKLRRLMCNNGDYEKGMSKTDCCPVCERPLGISKFVHTLSGSKFGDLYCKHCGQAISWTEDE